MVAPVVVAKGAAVAGKKAADNPWPLIIGAGALILLGKWGIGKIPFAEIGQEIKDKANIAPESREAVSGFYRGASDRIVPLTGQPDEGLWWADTGDVLGGGAYVLDPPSTAEKVGAWYWQYNPMNLPGRATRWVMGMGDLDTPAEIVGSARSLYKSAKGWVLR